ncbi:MAG TPA: UDP-N-acetylglucosamine 2-epimerase (non-hydrolyzing) [Syntrophales bacterium]|nr:UDP-N-acetylglucosamine 2-epimerase (non-hydrolyzing) [Syntrophales bacterium]
MPTIDLIAGARPNFMKIAPIIEALEKAKAKGSALGWRLVHTGQHYGRRLSQAFFDELGIPKPHVNLGAGSGTQAEQTAAIMLGYERLLLKEPSHMCMVVGDVNSTMACAIVARKCGIPVAHVEGGLRSRDWSMPEEINRVVTDSITNWFFTTTELAGENLRKEGVEEERIFFVGNTMIDSLLKHRHRFRPPEIWQEADLSPRKYLVLTLHRPSNVDDPGRLEGLLNAITETSNGMPIIFPVHPRTAKTMELLNRRYPDLWCTEPVGYLEFNYLVEHGLGVITDSGGITEETTVLGVPCLTLRENTERPETVTIGTNELVGTDPANVSIALSPLLSGQWKKGGVPPLWDGKAAQRIVAILERLFSV